MGIFKIPSIDRLIEWSQKHGEHLVSTSKGVGTKITSFVLECIGNDERKAPTFDKQPTAKVLDASHLPFKTPLLKQGKGKGFFGEAKERVPIGLSPCSESEWINAWLQFLIHIPHLVNLSPFAVKAFDPFDRFIEQYMWDQKEGRRVSKANSSSLFEVLGCPRSVSLTELTRSFFREMFPFPGGKSTSLIFHPEWIVDLDSIEELTPIFKQHPLEILARGKNLSLSEQLFPRKGSSFYDLTSFIEERPEGDRTSFIAYIKRGRVWYQCDNEAVIGVSSRLIRVPLQRGILFHYKKVWI